MDDYKIELPTQGSSKEHILDRMRNMRQQDIRWREGKSFAMIYDPGEKAKELLIEAFNLFFTENALNPTAFPSLRRMETEIIHMTANLLGGDSHVVGNMTSGGTESILMAVRTARDWARVNKPSILIPEMVLPETIHPAFEKAGDYFDVKVVQYPVDKDFRANLKVVKEYVSSNTILMAGSAPSYPHGVVDPISELAIIAQENDLLFHVDACLGGYLLPFVRKLGFLIPEFDFQVPGVTSISADLHKYGYAAKPASVILYRNKSIRRHQIFAYIDWAGGIYASPTMAGSRPGGTIAAAWAIMNHLGLQGYLNLTESIMRASNRLKEGIKSIEGLRILGKPVTGIMALAGEGLNIYEVGDELSLNGWYLERQQIPPSLHLTINPGHEMLLDEFLTDLENATKKAKRLSVRKVGNAMLLRAARAGTDILPKNIVSRLTSRASTFLGVKGASLPQRSAAMYGMMGSLPNRGDIKELVLDIVEQFTQPQNMD
ncbi:MAG: aspartate aminotransferase family protein [Anaerolineales bacterium]|jgi:glutamate/tyrosine decarboxylase-like PLP-dependent enzyme